MKTCQACQQSLSPDDRAANPYPYAINENAEDFSVNVSFHQETGLSNEFTSHDVKEKALGALAKAQQRRAEMKALGIAPKRKIPAGSVLMKAIKENCLQCEGEEDPCVRWRIANCLVPGCTLRPYRPFQNLENTPLPEALNYRGKD